MNKTAIALATAGAMTLGVAPAAMAAEGIPYPATMEVCGTTWYKADAGNAEDNKYTSNSKTRTYEDLKADTCAAGTGETDTQPSAPVDDSDIPLPATKTQGDKTWYLHDNGKVYVDDVKYIHAPIDQVPTDHIARTLGTVEDEGAANETDDNANGGSGDATKHDKCLGTAPATAEVDGQEVFLHNNGTVYVKDRNDWNTPVSELGADATVPVSAVCGTAGAGTGTGDNAGSAIDPEKAAKIAAGLIGAGVGAAIIINGIKYFVNKDKQTLVSSEDRVNQEPTAEEKAKSDELKANNADQIAQQTGVDTTSANGERGMSAATGVNKVPAALMALLLASVLGAAAFVFGRRQLV